MKENTSASNQKHKASEINRHWIPLKTIFRKKTLKTLLKILLVK